MNNRFFVPVLALGIAALGAAASPSQAATASLSGNFDGSSFSWVNSVNMTSSTTWTDAYLYQSKDNSNYGTCVCDGGPGNIVGPGTFTETEPVNTPVPAEGHSISSWIVDAGHTSGSSVVWNVTTNIVSVSSSGAAPPSS